ncbi:MAG: hypothetical protein JSS64_04155 [Bacteroidetes bacterium]|nr:hypothetical protein [Bacteroidota bacterium]
MKHLELSRFTTWFIALLFGLSFTISSHAQRYPFYNLSIEDGLIQTQIRGLAQDSIGNLWIATIGGLSRFDGVSFRNYTVRDGLPTNGLYSIAFDKHGILWIAHNRGISRFDGRTFTETPCKNRPVLRIKIAPDGSVWGVSKGHLIRLQNNRFSEIPMPDSGQFAYCVLPEKDTLWIGSKGKLMIYTRKGWDSLLVPPTHTFSNQFLIHLKRDAFNRILCATNTGIYRIDSGALKPIHVNGKPLDNLSDIRSICEDPDKNLWIGQTNGVIRVSDTTLQFFNKTNGFTNNSVEDILTDHEGNIWLGSDGQGLFRFSGARFTMLDESSGLPSQQIMSIGSDPMGHLYFGTYDNGLFSFENGKAYKIPVPLKGKASIFSLRYHNGELWFGTSGSGLFRYNGRRFKQYTREANRLISNTILSLNFDHKNRLWLGGVGGAMLYEHDTFHLLPINRRLVSDFVTIGNDSVLMSTENGLILWNNGTISRFITDSPADSSWLQCFALNGKNLWMGSSNNGLMCFNLQSKKFFQLGKENGIASDFVYNLIVDNAGYLWAGTGYGINKIWLDEAGNPKTEFYGKSDGILGMESNHGAVLKMHDGSIWFGTTDGAIHYRPYARSIQPNPSSIVLQSVLLFGEPLKDSSYYQYLDQWNQIPIGLRLPYKQNTLTFDFHAITLTGGGSLKYRYRIEGLDAPWSEWSKNTSITFSSLPPGKFQLHVQCKTTGETEIVRELFYPFEIITPFYRTIYFNLIILASCILLGILIQYIVHQRKLARLRLVERLRKDEQIKVRLRTAEDFHDEIGNRLTRINVLSNVLKKKLGKISPEGERIINQIQENTAQLYSGTHDILWSLKPTNDDLFEILHRIGDFGNELFQDTQTKFQFLDSDKDWHKYRLPLDISRNLIMIFKEALNNALKYAHAKHISLHATLRDDDVLQMVLKEDGRGFDLIYAKRGHGLDNMKLRAERIKGRLYFDSEKGKGTIITLTFKLVKK